MDDGVLLMAETRAARKAIVLVQSLHPFRATASRDEVGILRIGHGRAVERRPVSEATALHWLKSDMVEVQRTLRARVFDLLALQPEAEARLPQIYAVADLLGADMVRDAAPLWAALRRADWRAAATELLLCQWDRWYGTSDEKRRAVIGLVTAVAAPEGAG
jgi:hypothetical protein